MVESVVRPASSDALQIRMPGYSVDDLVHRLARLTLLPVKSSSAPLRQNRMRRDAGAGIFADASQASSETILRVDGSTLSLKARNLLYQSVPLLVAS